MISILSFGAMRPVLISAVCNAVLISMVLSCALVTSGAGCDLAAVEAELAVDQLVHEAGTVEANIVPVSGFVHRRAVEGSGLAEAAVLVDLMENVDFLGSEPHSSAINALASSSVIVLPQSARWA